MNFPSSSHKQALRIQHINGLDAVKNSEWNRLAGDSNPFLSHEFLGGLERHKCLDGHGWQPHHLVVHEGDTLVGALPLYLKSNSYGEFVFDWSWADAYERAGGNYYPKLVSAIPFSPVRGPRFLIDNTNELADSIKLLLLNTVRKKTDTTGISSFHCLFPEQGDEKFMRAQNLLMRKGIQYHWHNRGYRDFDDFLDTLTSKKRKQIKRERKQIRENRIEIEVLKGADITGELWSIFYEFYCSTFYRRWGAPRMTYDFFVSLSRVLPESTLLLLARRDGAYVAGAYAMLGSDTLYGRHWGCSADYPYLHFELCYYQTIEYCIRNGLRTVDAGVQGEHKLSRGFEPEATWSGHWIRHKVFREAVRDFVDRELPSINAYIRELNNHLPYKDKEV